MQKKNPLKKHEIAHKVTAWQLREEFWMPRAIISPSLTKLQVTLLKKALKPTEEYWVMSRNEKKNFSAQLVEIDKALMEHHFPSHVIVKFCFAIQGKGLYAAEDIQEGELIGLYAGVIVDDDETDEGNRYLFGIGEGFSIDAASCGNYTRAINNTTAHHANASAYKIKLSGNPVTQIAFMAHKKIHKDQQILFSYGSQYFQALKIKPLVLSPNTQ